MRIGTHDIRGDELLVLLYVMWSEAREIGAPQISQSTGVGQSSVKRSLAALSDKGLISVKRKHVIKLEGEAARIVEVASARGDLLHSIKNNRTER